MSERRPAGPAVHLPLCVHNHQPVGNFPDVLERAFSDSYMPFVETLSRHPSIRFTIHNSGFLLDWIAENHPEYIELLGEMVSRGQVEIMGGGYFEPILAVIPEADRQAQIRLMAERIEDLFGVRPGGLWLAERVWDPTLPVTLVEAGVEYVLVDDFHFIKAGVENEALRGFYITEERARALKVFPGSERLRYLIPFKPLDEVRAFFESLRETSVGAAIYGDDGEKFGVWPGTRKWVFEEGWLEGFFKLVESLDFVKTWTLAEYAERNEPLGRVYLPTASYMEMGEWSLPAPAAREYADVVESLKKKPEGEKIGRFIQGGTWRNFFAKYPESNWMHKRMLYAGSHIEDKSPPEAKRRLFMAQCNDAYWHGVFGGLYLPHLRGEVYKNILLAEKEAGAPETSLSVVDVDADLNDEVVIRTRELNLFISPSIGGALFELDHRNKCVNLANVLTRWPEAYHEKIREARASGDGDVKSIHDIIAAKEKDIARFLKTDTVRRGSFVDRFFRADVAFETFLAGEAAEEGGFSNAPYEAEVAEERVLLKRIGPVDDGIARVIKEIGASGERVTAAYRVDAPSPARFAVEFNILMPACDGPATSVTVASDRKRLKKGLGETFSAEGVRSALIEDRFTGLAAKFTVDRPLELWSYPLYTVSLSESGFERTFQGTSLVFTFIHEGGERTFTIDMDVSEI